MEDELWRTLGGGVWSSAVPYPLMITFDEHAYDVTEHAHNFCGGVAHAHTLTQ